MKILYVTNSNSQNISENVDKVIEHTNSPTLSLTTTNSIIKAYNMLGIEHFDCVVFDNKKGMGFDHITHFLSKYYIPYIIFSEQKPNVSLHNTFKERITNVLTSYL
jgi:DNA polymerase III alpha subunit (gram-positive type)